MSNERPIKNIDPAFELNKGSFALWLSADDLVWLSARCLCIEQESPRRARAMRANSISSQCRST